MPLEALNMPGVDRSAAGMPSHGQGLKRKAQSHFVRRCLDRSLHLGFAALTAFLLAHGLPVLDVINANAQG